MGVAQVALTGYGDADAAVEGPAARGTFGVSGAGIKVGILSDSLNVLGGEAADIAEGLLPASGVTVLKEGPAGATDEGRALAQLVHATAPDAQLYFATAYATPAEYAASISALVAAGCRIILDDIAYPDEPFFQAAGPIATATAAAIAAGVDYFSAAGNEDDGFYQGAWPRGGAVTQTVTVPAYVPVTLALQWDAPYEAANPATLTAVASGGVGPIASYRVGSEPVALLDFPVATVARTYRITITQTPGTPTPTLFKDVLEGGGSFTSPGSGVGSGSIFGQGVVPGVNAVGAVDVARAAAPVAEPYSSTGPGTLLFAPDGTRLATPRTLDVPSFLAPDGSTTSVFDPFYGTSAAAPVAAAVAALMLQARPDLGTEDVTALLQDSATSAGAPSVAGAGLINADLALTFAQSSVIYGSPQTTVRGLALPCTLAGGAGAHVLVAGSGRTLIGSEGTDTVIAGAGADTVDLAGASALLFGASGSLWVRDLGGADTVVGGSGAVSVSGGSGGGVQYGGAAGGNRLVAGAAPTMLVGGGAGDTLVAAGGGNDTLFAPPSGAATLLGGASGGNIFVAGGGEAVIATGSGTNQVWLGGGAATVYGGAGNMVFGGGTAPALVFGGAAGGNLMFAGSGATTLVGGGAGDILVGNGPGDALIAAPGGEASLYGGTGAEIFAGGDGGIDLFALQTADALVAPGGARAVITFGSGNANVEVGSAAELFNFVAGQGGGSALVRGFDAGQDMVRLAGFGAGGAAAVAAQASSGGSTALTLPDGTHVVFAGLAALSPANVVFA